MRSVFLLVWITLLSPLFPCSVTAQRPADSSGEQLFTGRDALWAGGFTVGTLLLAPLDVQIAGAVRDSALQQNQWISNSASGLRFLGLPGALLITTGMYAAGRVTENPALADMGLHSAGAITLATAITLGTKALAGRARPRVDPRKPMDFRLGRGWRNDHYQSFPSGHATIAFATAAAITAEVEDRWPDAEMVVGSALFGAATLVGVSRLYHNEHWASDVLVGAGIGTFAGWKVVQYTHRNPDNRLDRWLLGATISPVPGGRVAQFWIAPGF